MSSSRTFERIARAAARRPFAVVVAVTALSLAAAVLALRLEPRAGTDTLVSRGSETHEATEFYRQRFGDDSVVILVRGELPQLVLTANIQRVLGLEGCIAGNVPAGQEPIGGRRSACAAFARSHSVQVVYGPGTFINEAVRQIQEQFVAQQRRTQDQERRAAEAAQRLAAAQGRSKADQRRLGAQARELVRARFLRDTLRLALNYGIRSIPRLNDPDFVSNLVFDPQRGANKPKARFAYLFPNERSALIQVRLKPGLPESDRRQAIEDIRAATRMRRFRLEDMKPYVVTGAPVVVDDLTRSITDSILVLLLAALVVMAATLLLVFRSRPRLLPLGLALGAAALTFGGMSLAGASLTMAAIAVLPVLIGLAVDYAIQLQSRFDEEAQGGDGGAAEAAARAAAAGGPTIATAGIATVTGFLVLLLSPVPMVRGFGLLLVVGIVLAFFCTLSAGFAALVLARQGPEPLPGSVRRLGAQLGAATRGAAELLTSAGRGARELVLRDPPPARPGELEPRILPRRALAWLLDAAALAALVRLLHLLDLPLAVFVTGLVLLGLGYLVVLPGLTGLTPGKLLLGVRIVRAPVPGRAPGLRAALLRTLALPADAFGLVALPAMLTSSRRRRLGDRLVGTDVVWDPRPLRARFDSVMDAALAAVTSGARAATVRPARVVGIAALVAVVGLALDTQTRVVSDVRELVPQDSRALRDLRTLQDSTSVSGEIDVVVRSRDISDPKVVKWMTEYQTRLLRKFGYTAQRGCDRAKLCPALSLPDLFRTGGATDSARIRALLNAVPAYFSQAVVTRDRRVATMAFGIRLMPLDEQQRVIEEMRKALKPPRGVSATVAGLPVLAAEANANVSADWRRLLTLAVGLLAVGLVLLLLLRRPERALVPLVPIALASGWSALVLFAVRVPLNPMSVTLGALVIAISTEFSVLLAERYRQERAAGLGPDAALERTYRSTGAAVLASGATAIAGFAVLVFSDIRMLRDFGFVTVIDLSVSLVGVMLVLPAVLVLAERGELLDLPVRAARRLRAVRPRLRRRARTA